MFAKLFSQNAVAVAEEEPNKKVDVPNVLILFKNSEKSRQHFWHDLNCSARQISFAQTDETVLLLRIRSPARRDAGLLSCSASQFRIGDNLFGENQSLSASGNGLACRLDEELSSLYESQPDESLFYGLYEGDSGDNENREESTNGTNGGALKAESDISKAVNQKDAEEECNSSDESGISGISGIGRIGSEDSGKEKEKEMEMDVDDAFNAFRFWQTPILETELLPEPEHDEIRTNLNILDVSCFRRRRRPGTLTRRFMFLFLF